MSSLGVFLGNTFNTFEKHLLYRHFGIFIIGVIIGLFIMLILCGIVLNRLKIIRRMDDISVVKIEKNNKFYYCINPSSKKESIYILLLVIIADIFMKDKTLFLKNKKFIKNIIYMMVIMLLILFIFGIGLAVIIINA